MISVHDNEILGYSVDFTNSTLSMRTKGENRDNTQYVDIIFEGIITYFFENQIPGNIIPKICV